MLFWCWMKLTQQKQCWGLGEMIFLINHERVLLEMLELAKHKISEILEVELNDVKAILEVVDNRIKPYFDVQLSTTQSFEKAFVERAIAGVWTEVKRELVKRLAGLKDRRYAEKETIDEGRSKEAQN